MAVSRPVLLGVLGLLLATATLFAARGAGQSTADSAQISAAPVATPPPDAPPVDPAPAGRPGGRAAGDTRPGTQNGSDRDAKRDARADRTPARGGKPRPAPGKTAGALTGAERSLPAGVPPDVGRALRARRVVVLFFGQGGADDQATATAVASLRDLKGVAVFTDGIQNLGKYTGVVTGLGVAQAPAVVIVGPRRRARLIEGFIDSGTLTQRVLDAR